ncbi:Dbf4-Type Zinc Finger-Containing Protein 2 [Manis pentadactyla]|nr:Dbf4-Type Zinc Finger-Containing Protein 2 [Manis pentadactyla]
MDCPRPPVAPPGATLLEQEAPVQPWQAYDWEEESNWPQIREPENAEVASDTESTQCHFASLPRCQEADRASYLTPMDGFTILMIYPLFGPFLEVRFKVFIEERYPCKGLTNDLQNNQSQQWVVIKETSSDVGNPKIARQVDTKGVSQCFGKGITLKPENAR